MFLFSPRNDIRGISTSISLTINIILINKNILDG